MPSQKKSDLYYQKWEWSLWFSDLNVRALALDTRMVWGEMLGRMWLSNERGYLVGSNGQPLPDEAMAASIPVPVKAYRQHLKIIENAGLFSRRVADNAIFSRKIIHDLEVSEQKAESGRKGARATWGDKDTAKAGAKADTLADLTPEAIAGALAIAKAGAVRFPDDDNPEGG